MFRGISNAGANEQFITQKTTLTQADVGKAVCIVANDTVGLGNNGDEIAGKLIRVEADGVCNVQCGGYMELAYSALPSYGGKLVADGTGKVKPAPGIDPTASTTQAVKGRGFVINTNTTDQVVGVHL